MADSERKAPPSWCQNRAATFLKYCHAEIANYDAPKPESASPKSKSTAPTQAKSAASRSNDPFANITCDKVKSSDCGHATKLTDAICNRKMGGDQSLCPCFNDAVKSACNSKTAHAKSTAAAHAKSAAAAQAKSAAARSNDPFANITCSDLEEKECGHAAK